MQPFRGTYLKFALQAQFYYLRMAIFNARMAELVDALVSKTSGLCPCRFDPGSGYSIWINYT